MSTKETDTLFKVTHTLIIKIYINIVINIHTRFER